MFRITKELLIYYILSKEWILPNMKKALLVLLFVCTSIPVLNYIRIGSRVSSAINKDERNKGIIFSGRVAYYVNPSELILNLTQVDPTKAPIDVFRSLLQISESLSEYDFDKVILQYDGKDKFILTGKYFKNIG